MSVNGVEQSMVDNYATSQQVMYNSVPKNVTRKHAKYIPADNNQKINKTTVTDHGFKPNQCSDGNNDGKIGLFSAVGNLIEGAAKGVINGIKGCFTNSEGKFSLGKTLLSAGIVAASVAFPVVGLAACTAGAVVGGIQVGKGLKTAFNTEGKSDAEVKAAWENIGAGAVTVAGCVTGAKASLNALRPSTADDIVYIIDDVVDSVDDTLKLTGGANDELAGALKALDKADGAADNVLLLTDGTSESITTALSLPESAGDAVTTALQVIDKVDGVSDSALALSGGNIDGTIRSVRFVSGTLDNTMDVINSIDDVSLASSTAMKSFKYDTQQVLGESLSHYFDYQNKPSKANYKKLLKFMNSDKFAIVEKRNPQLSKQIIGALFANNSATA